jgi:hypothetical protein
LPKPGIFIYARSPSGAKRAGLAMFDPKKPIEATTPIAIAFKKMGS